MASLGPNASSGGGSRRGRRFLNAEINMVPFIDVMLVLLVVFMITAPLLVQGEDVELPQTRSGALASTQDQPLTLTILADGTIRLQQTDVPKDELAAKLLAITDAGYEEQIFIRADANTPYGDVIGVVADIRAVGFNRLAFVTEPIDLEEAR